MHQSGQQRTARLQKAAPPALGGRLPPCLTKPTLEGSCQLHAPSHLFPKIMISQENQSSEESKEETKTQSPFSLLLSVPVPYNPPTSTHTFHGFSQNTAGWSQVHFQLGYNIMKEIITFFSVSLFFFSLLVHFSLLNSPELMRYDLENVHHDEIKRGWQEPAG